MNISNISPWAYDPHAYEKEYINADKYPDGTPRTGDDYAPQTLEEARAMDRQTTELNARFLTHHHGGLYFWANCSDYFIHVSKRAGASSGHTAYITARKFVEEFAGSGPTRHAALVDCLTKFVESYLQREICFVDALDGSESLGNLIDYDNVGIDRAFEAVFTDIRSRLHPKMLERIRQVNASKRGQS